jgi:prepilin-type N-terminal cleavage/methylation domain-containing protein
MRRHFRDERGFTLIEMIIVVILMGILAAVIIPQISMSTDEAKLNALTTDLAGMRNIIEVYYLQHNNTYPGAKDGMGGIPPNAAAAATAFFQQLTQYTDLNGVVSTTKTAAAKFGPYIKSVKLPANPYLQQPDASQVTCDLTTDDITDRTISGGTEGWKFYIKTGVFVANDSAAHAAL